jgi:hypothetical protein
MVKIDLQANLKWGWEGLRGGMGRGKDVLI